MSDDSKNKPDLNLVVGKFDFGKKVDRKALVEQLVEELFEILYDEKYEDITTFEIIGILRVMDQAFVKTAIAGE